MELVTRRHRRRVIYEESRIAASKYVIAAVDKVDPPANRKKRAREAKAARIADRNNMIRAAIALVEAVNARSELECLREGKGSKCECWHFNRSTRNSIDAPSGSTLTAKFLQKEETELLRSDDVTTTRAKLLHFLAVARMPKAALAQKYELLRPLLASNDGAGGFTALHPSMVKSLMVGSPEDIVSVRSILPTLGFDPRNDLVTLERLPEFAPTTRA